MRARPKPGSPVEPLRRAYVAIRKLTLTALLLPASVRVTACSLYLPLGSLRPLRRPEKTNVLNPVTLLREKVPMDT